MNLMTEFMIVVTFALVVALVGGHIFIDVPTAGDTLAAVETVRALLEATPSPHR